MPSARELTQTYEPNPILRAIYQRFFDKIQVIHGFQNGCNHVSSGVEEYKIQDGSKLFAYARILYSIMYERVVLLRPVVVVPPKGPWEPCMRRWGHGGALLECYDKGLV